MKKVLSIFLSFIMLFSAMTALNTSAYAAERSKNTFVSHVNKRPKKVKNKRPKKVKIKSVVENKNGDIKMIWQSVADSSGYQIFLAKDRNFKRDVVKVTVSGRKDRFCIKKKILCERPHYAKIRAFKTVKGKKVYGNWSLIKTIRQN